MAPRTPDNTGQPSRTPAARSRTRQVWLGGLLPLLNLWASTAAAAGLAGVVVTPDGSQPTNTVVYLLALPGQRPPPQQPVVIEQRQMRFVPRVAVVQVGQRVVFQNGDLMGHNVFSSVAIQGFNLGIYPPGANKEQVFQRAGVVPLLCNLHPDMTGFIVVVPTPYFARVGPSGRFSLRDVPAGRFELVAWREGLAEERITVDTTLNQQLTIKLRKEN